VKKLRVRFDGAKRDYLPSSHRFTIPASLPRHTAYQKINTIEQRWDGGAVNLFSGPFCSNLHFSTDCGTLKFIRRVSF
jgi:hypothetical protein